MSCHECRNYSPLKTPRTMVDADGEYKIYGYCFARIHQSNYYAQKGHPVYQPDAVCDGFDGEKGVIQGQLNLFDTGLLMAGR